jgi:hypothetical protein
MSGTKKLLLGLGMGCGLVVLLCCGGGGAFFYFVARSMQASSDPKEVVELTKSMADLAIPEGLQPSKSFNMEKMPMFGQLIPSWVLYQNKQAGATLLLAQSKVLQSQPQANIRQTIQQMMGPIFQQQGVEFPNRELAEKNKEIDTHVCTIRGVQVTFTIVTGDDEQTKARRIRVTGVFPGKVTSVALLLDADADKLAKPAVVKMLDSIH